MSAIAIHATAVAIEGHGVLIVGASGSGKSDLALRLIDRGAMLVSDDAVTIYEDHDFPILKTAPNITGKLELRGVGICAVASVEQAPLRLVVELVEQVDRMPSAHLTTPVGEYDVSTVKLMAFEISAAIKLEYALRSIVDAGLWPVARTTTASGKGNRI